MGLGLVRGHARDSLELLQLGVLRPFQLLLQLLRMRLAIGDALLTPSELRELAVDLVLLGQHPLLDLDDLGSALRDLLLDVRPELHGLLAGFDLSLAPHRLGVAARLGQEQLPRPARRREPRAGQRVQGYEGEGRPSSEADQDSNDDEHGRSWRCAHIRHASNRVPRRALRKGPAGRYFTAGAASRELVRSGASSSFIPIAKQSDAGKLSYASSYPSSGPALGAIPRDATAPERDQSSKACVSAETAASIDSGAKPRAASHRAVRAPAPRRSASRLARSRSGSSAASAGAVVSRSIPSRSSLNAIAASPRPRSASAEARPRANRPSSTAPCRRSVATASSRSRSPTPFRSRMSRRSRSERPRRASARAPASSASVRRSSRRSVRRCARSSSSPSSRPVRAATSSETVRQGSPSSSTSTRPGCAGRSAVTVAIGGSLLVGSGLLLCVLLDRGRQQARRDHLVWAGVGLDLRQDLLRHVRMLAQERGRILPPLAEPLVAEAEVRARLGDDLSIEPRVEHRAFPGDSRAVDDVELGLLERRRDLVLDHLDPDAVAVGLDAFLERLDPADVETDGRVELQRAAARGRLGIAEHDADLLA